MNIKLVIRMGLTALWYVDVTKAALEQQKGVERHVEDLARGRRLKTPTTRKPTKTRKPTTPKPTSIPTSSPTVQATFIEPVSELIPLEGEPPIGKWHYSIEGCVATATFAKLQDEIFLGEDSTCQANTDLPGKLIHPDLVANAPDSITSALRLYTGLYDNENQVNVGITFYNGGLFNGMTFKNMVDNGITFEYNFFRALMPDDLYQDTPVEANTFAAPAIIMTIKSGGTEQEHTLIWEPYWGGCADSCTSPIVSDKWLYVSVSEVTGATPTSGWWKAGTVGQLPLRSLKEWSDPAAFGPAFMADAVVVYVGFGLGSWNRGVISYVDSLKIKSGGGGYEWKWVFETGD